jgi:hypothetical protein
MKPSRATDLVERVKIIVESILRNKSYVDSDSLVSLLALAGDREEMLKTANRFYLSRKDFRDGETKTEAVMQSRVRTAFGILMAHGDRAALAKLFERLSASKELSEMRSPFGIGEPANYYFSRNMVEYVRQTQSSTADSELKSKLAKYLDHYDYVQSKSGAKTADSRILYDGGLQRDFEAARKLVGSAARAKTESVERASNATDLVTGSWSAYLRFAETRDLDGLYGVYNAYMTSNSGRGGTDAVQVMLTIMAVQAENAKDLSQQKAIGSEPPRLK